MLDLVSAGFAGLAVRSELKEAALRSIGQWWNEARYAEYRPMLERLVADGRWDLLLDSFYQVMPFGTGGRRGTVGIGTNRFNPDTLSASVQGHAEFLRARFGDLPLHVVIAYDVRVYRDASGAYPKEVTNPLLGLSSRDFAEIAAGVYAANGVSATLLPPDSPTFVSTPELSFAIRFLGAQGGLNVSASHNPPDDNGGKFYNERGGQEVPPDDEEMARRVEAVREVRAMSYGEAHQDGWVKDYGPQVHAAYVRTNLATSLLPSARSVHVVFTGLHGTGDTTVVDVLRAAGFPVDVEPTQAPHDGSFAEVPFRTPNPEVPQSMDRAVALASAIGADLVMACDPDADRIGLVARDGTGWRFFTGNEIAVLVAEHRLTAKHWDNPIVMKTEVTSELVSRVARRHGAQVVGDLLVGFKYIGDGLRQLETTGRFNGVTGTPEDLVVGVEESHGVLVTAALRDKDAAGAALALAEMASALKEDGRTLADALRAIWDREGFVVNRLVSTVMRGAAGKARIERIQAALRAQPPSRIAGLEVTEFFDRADPNGSLGPIRSGTDAASRDVLVFRLGADARVLLRPSGTEPKNKIYVEVCGSPGEAQAAVEARAQAIAMDFAAQMLATVDIQLPAWALMVSDLVAIESKLHFANTLLPDLRARLARGEEVRDWLDAELRPYGKDPRGLVATAVRAWASEGHSDAEAVLAAF